MTPASVSILLFVATIIISLVVYVFQSYKSSSNARIKKVEGQVDGIIVNYLDRFKEVNTTISTSKEEILDRIHDLHIIITRK